MVTSSSFATSRVAFNGTTSAPSPSALAGLAKFPKRTITDAGRTVLATTRLGTVERVAPRLSSSGGRGAPETNAADAETSAPAPLIRSRSSVRLSAALDEAEVTLKSAKVFNAVKLLVRDGAANHVENVMVLQARRSTQWDLNVTNLAPSAAAAGAVDLRAPSMLARSQSIARQRTRGKNLGSNPSSRPGSAGSSGGGVEDSDDMSISAQYHPVLASDELESGWNGGGGLRVKTLILAEADTVNALEVMTMAVIRLKQKRS